MKNEKVCISKSVGIFAVVGVVLIGLVLLMGGMANQKTSTSTRAGYTEDANACAKMKGWVAYTWNSQGLAPLKATDDTCVKFTGNWYGDASHTRPNGGKVTRVAETWVVGAGNTGAGITELTAEELTYLSRCELSAATYSCSNPVNNSAKAAIVAECDGLKDKGAYSWGSSGETSATAGVDDMCVAYTGRVFDYTNGHTVPNAGKVQKLNGEHLKCMYGPATSCKTLTPTPGGAARKTTDAACLLLKDKSAYSWSNTGEAAPADMCIVYSGYAYTYGAENVKPNGGKVTVVTPENRSCALSGVAVSCKSIIPAKTAAEKLVVTQACDALKGQVAYTWNSTYSTTGAGDDDKCVTYTGTVFSYDATVQEHQVPLNGTATAQATANKLCALSAQMNCAKAWYCDRTASPVACKQSVNYYSGNQAEVKKAGKASSPAVDLFLKQDDCDTACYE